MPSPPAKSKHGSFVAGERVSVMLPLPLGAAYDYCVPAGLTLAAGDFVTVPLASRQISGVVWGAGEGRVAARKTKDVAARLDTPPLPKVSRRFVEWVARYTLCPAGAVLKMAMSVPAALHPPRPVTAYALAETPPEVRLTPARQRVIGVLSDGPPRPASELARAAGVGPSVVRGLAGAGVLVQRSLPRRTARAAPDWRNPGPTLSADQSTAARALKAMAAADAFAVTLLDGVPGSGKTEVYFEAVAETLGRGRQVLVMLPEIALGAQWMGRFRTRFGAAPAEWHSDLTPAQRRVTWRAVAEGRERIVVGARSALFLPFPDLGLIVIDEEHDAAFKQEEGVIYNARDMAVVRARLGEVPLVLASATPSLESFENARAGRYGTLHLPDRHAGASLPDVALIDMRSEAPSAGRWLSQTLLDAIRETLEAGEQAMLFLNRRGYAPLTLCRACGHRLQCPRCTAWLVEHRKVERLQCHHCGYTARLPRACPSCEAEGTLAACGPGVERLAEEVSEWFPDARQAVAASDTLTGPKAAADLVRGIEEHRVDVLIGTQIVAKGHHFPMLTLVGVVDADLGLAGGDLRAAERTYQLLYQVAGRAGRAERPGRVLVQTYMPESAVMRTLVSGERQSFLDAEAKDRRDAGMPPFGRLAAIVVSGRDESAVNEVARRLGRAAPRSDGIQVLGPAPASLALLRGRHRRRLLLKAGREVNVQAALRAWLNAAQVPRSVRVRVDVDPYSFL
ncbi:MAG: primosomal protein N' [Rhodospirillales bacterium]|jgi:primosomal protein N' (replication factor Y)|nr:primosomal protein N' [Rhodospirillales bacterium]